MKELKNSDKPEVYALSQAGGDWRISRRDFLKTAGIGAAALGAGSSGRFVRPVHAGEDMAALCSNAPAHKYEIVDLIASADGRYLITLDKKNVFKCWDFSTYSLLSTFSRINGSQPALYSGTIDGKPRLFFTQDSDAKKYIWYLDLPEMEKKERDYRASSLESENIIGVAVGTDESIYEVTDGQKIYWNRKWKENTAYQPQKSLKVSENGWKYVLCGSGQKLAAGFASGDFGTIDLTDGSIRKFETPKIRDFAILPGEAEAILIEDSDDGAYRLVSMIDGMTKWEKSLSEFGPETTGLRGTVTTPDGSNAVLVGNNTIRLVSTADGSLIGSFSADVEKSSTIGKAAVSGDGSKMAVAVDKSIFFISLPDLNVIGCPVDLDGMTTDTKAVEISGKDPVTGQPVNYTLPCGAPIPAGAVCTCNCVAGKITTYGSGGSHGGHYWHPN